MAARTWSASFEGADARRVDVQVQIAGGMPAFSVVGLADKAVAESRERIRAAFAAIGLSLPTQRIIVNLAPADRPKEGAHFDLPIALGLMAVMGVLPGDFIEEHLCMGELGLDGSIASCPGVLTAAMLAVEENRGFICPQACGPEAAWAGGELAILAPRSLLQLVNHVRGDQVLSRPQPGDLISAEAAPDLAEVRGQETAKRALEIAAAGGHNLLMIGPPGSGKSMMAARLPGLLPPLSARELLEVSRIRSVAGLLDEGRLTRTRPFRAPHHSASMAALVGGGVKARPGEASLAHHGVLFLDELPEFHPQALDGLREPLETGEVTIARANHRVTYAARFQLVAAMNPCKCGATCLRGPACAQRYQARVSGPFLDRIDLQIAVPAVSPADLALPPPKEGTAEAAARVLAAREAQAQRGRINARLAGAMLDQYAAPDEAGRALLARAADALQLTARGYHRVLRCARTIADLDGSDAVRRIHVAEALSARRAPVAGEAISRPPATLP